MDSVIRDYIIKLKKLRESLRGGLFRNLAQGGGEISIHTAYHKKEIVHVHVHVHVHYKFKFSTYNNNQLLQIINNKIQYKGIQ